MAVPEPIGTNVPAVMAVLGESGVEEGEDYRGVDVLSAIGPVPDSPWFIVAKVDAAEALAMERLTSTLLIALAAGLVLAVATAVLLARWQRGKKGALRSGTRRGGAPDPVGRKPGRDIAFDRGRRHRGRRRREGD